MIEGSIYNSEDDFEERIRDDLKNKKDFCVKTSKNMSFAVASIKTIMKESGLRCRVYTSKRSGAATTAAVGGLAVLSIESIPFATALAFTPAAVVVGIVGIGAGIGILVHNIATRNPDYEVIKYPLSGDIVVKYRTRIEVK